MTIRLLGPGALRFWPFLAAPGVRVVHTNEATESWSATVAPDDLLISYGYRFLVRPALLAQLQRPPINLHIALLPWNRGADPNLWSVLEDTPSGVTIHEMDAGLDTGPILVQQPLAFAETETLATSYAQLQAAIEDLFRAHWPELQADTIRAVAQPAGGSTHRSRDKEGYAALLTRGWDTPIGALRGRAKAGISH